MALETLAAAFLLAQAEPAALQFSQGVFSIQTGGTPLKVPVDPGLVPMNPSTGRIWLPVNKSVWTFDSNGVGYRANNKATYDKLVGLPVSPKLFSEDEIRANAADVKAGKKSFAVSAISGWHKLGNKVYFLARWDDKSNSPWLEALMQTDFNGKVPKTTLVGRFDGFTHAAGRVNSKLILQDGSLVASVFTADGPAIAKYDIAQGLFSSNSITGVDSPPRDIKLLEGSRYGLSFRKTPANTILVGVLNTEDNTHSLAAEVRGSILGAYSPSHLLFRHDGRKVLINLLTGAEILIPEDAGLRSTPQGLLLWTPAKEPAAAALYAFGSYRTVARWSKTVAKAR